MNWLSSENSKHPFIVALVTALLAAIVGGLFNVYAAYVQANGPRDTKEDKAQSQTRPLPIVPLEDQTQVPPSRTASATSRAIVDARSGASQSPSTETVEDRHQEGGNGVEIAAKPMPQPVAVPPPTWELAPAGGLATSVAVSAARPNAIRVFKRGYGFRVVLTLSPSGGRPALMLPLHGGHIGGQFRLRSASGTTSEGESCTALTKAENSPITYQIPGYNDPPPTDWRTLDGPVTLVLEYTCGKELKAGDSVSFDVGLYILDGTLTGRQSSWRSSAIPVNATSVRLQ